MSVSVRYKFIKTFVGAERIHVTRFAQRYAWNGFTRIITTATISKILNDIHQNFANIFIAIHSLNINEAMTGKWQKSLDFSLD